MDNAVREILEKEVNNLKARVVLQEVQLSTLEKMNIQGAQAEQISQTKAQTKNQLQFDKEYAKALEKLLFEETNADEPKEEKK